MANIPGYKLDAGANFVREQGDKRWLYVYNGTGAAVTNGAVYQVSFFDDVDTYFPKLLAPATDAIAHAIIGVVENSAEGKSTIDSDEWGWVQVRGYCATVTNTGGATDEYSLEVTDGTVAAANDANGTLSANSFAICKETKTTGLSGGAYLLGRENVIIAAS
jgi:hypothetical protein